MAHSYVEYGGRSEVARDPGRVYTPPLGQKRCSACLHGGGVAVLELIGLSRHFGGLHILQDLALEIRAGEVLGILGPNGAGKSTLFNLIGGNLLPSAGQVRFQGVDITGQRTWDRCRLGIGRTFQIPKPFGHLSVFENTLVAAVHGAGMALSPARGQAWAALQMTGLAARADWEARRLSLLDLKRLELAKALALKPRLLLLDEIAGGLTDSECEPLLEIIRRVHAQGTTVVWIEHVLHALRKVATRLAVLYGGAILVSGTPDEVLVDARVREVYLGT